MDVRGTAERRESVCRGVDGGITGETGSDDEDVRFATGGVENCWVGSVYLE